MSQTLQFVQGSERIAFAMAHRLDPISEGAYLRPAEIAERLVAEFDFVDADADEGTGHIVGMIEQFQRMNMPQAVIDAHRAMLGHALRIIVSDREAFDEDYLSFTAMPETALLIGYQAGQHEATAAPLLKRACSILRYYSTLV